MELLTDQYKGIFEDFQDKKKKKKKICRKHKHTGKRLCVSKRNKFKSLKIVLFSELIKLLLVQVSELSLRSGSVPFMNKLFGLFM